MFIGRDVYLKWLLQESKINCKITTFSVYQSERATAHKIAFKKPSKSNLSLSAEQAVQILVSTQNGSETERIANVRQATCTKHIQETWQAKQQAWQTIHQQRHALLDQTFGNLYNTVSSKDSMESQIVIHQLCSDMAQQTIVLQEANRKHWEAISQSKQVNQQ